MSYSDDYARRQQSQQMQELEHSAYALNRMYDLLALKPSTKPDETDDDETDVKENKWVTP